MENMNKMKKGSNSKEPPLSEQRTQKEKYEVFVDDNFHFMDENERYKLAEFDTCKEATAACKKIVDDFLEKGYKEGMSFKELYGGYTGFGEDPFIVSDDDQCFFSAWNYARKRSTELCSVEK